MSLAPGARLGPYEVLAPVGAGGMGEVYKAQDRRLDRPVAIKVLPAHVASDPERKQRFEREAKTLAALSHPHICPVFDVGQQNGVDFLVMEYLEGETLAQRLTSKGALPLDQALQYAIQIADALDKAHRKGIVHRDLKPSNVMLTKQGVKLLDFGLAKLQPAGAVGGMSLAATVSSPLTGEGAILGTLHYMAPEQVEGKETDARSDIFSFGALVYEMATGKRAFEGKSAASVMAAILDREPPKMSSLQPLTPPALDHVVSRCLAKDPDERWQAAGDVMRELRWITEAPRAGATIAATARHGSRERVAWTLLATAGLMIVALSIPATLYLRERPVANPEMRLEITTPATSSPLHFALSPDGLRLAFVASGDGPQRLWVRSLDNVTAQPLPGTEGAEYPFWSPDSRSIGFSSSGKVRRVDIGGGPPQTLADAPAFRGGAWSRDGTILFATTAASPLWRIPATGGEPVPATTIDPPRYYGHRYPQFLPDGRHFLFFAGGSSDRRGIYLGSLEGGEPKRLTDADTFGAYVEPGALFFMRQGALLARHLDVAAGMLTGDPLTVADPVSYESFGLGGFSVSASGRLAYRTSASERRQLTWLDRTGRMVGMAGEPDANDLLGPELSPDARSVAVTRTVQSNTDIWLLDLLRGGATPFTRDPGIDGSPIWSPDGARIAFFSTLKGTFDLYLKPSSGGGEEALIESSNVKLPLDWSHDGRFLLYIEIAPKTGYDLWALPMVGERKPVLVANTPYEERNGQFSSDGRWVAYQSNESGRFEVYVQPFPGTGGKQQISIAGGEQPRWRVDGKELFFLAPDSKLMAVTVQASGGKLDADSPVALFQTRTPVSSSAIFKAQYAVSRDGRFLINMPLEDSNAAPITLILNWKPRP